MSQGTRRGLYFSCKNGVLETGVIKDTDFTRSGSIGIPNGVGRRVALERNGGIDTND